MKPFDQFVAPIFDHTNLAYNEHGPQFAEPWQAQIFAIAVELNQAGHFVWSEWAQTLGEAIAEAERGDEQSDYHQCWLIALERLLQRKGVLSAGEMDARTQAWHAAAARTPHGQPIELATDTPRK